MQEIVIKTQAELDALPDDFTEETTIEIRSDSSVVICLRKPYDSSRVVAYDSSRVEAYGSSSVEAYDSSRVEAYDSSRVEAYGSSSVDLFISAYAIIFSSSVTVGRVLDYSTAIFKGCKERTEDRSETSSVREIPAEIDVSSEEWLRRGYVVADGIHNKLKSQKTIGDVVVFETEKFATGESAYVVKKGNLFSHG